MTRLNPKGFLEGLNSAGRSRKLARRLVRRRNALGQQLRTTLFQPLEERIMLDIGGANSVSPTIVVGRTLSAYDVPDIQNQQETITLTAYNQTSTPIDGVLLTDTLKPGVTFASASQLPDQNGQHLAWSLGTIQPYDRASVTLTVSLTNPIPTTLDTGASAYGTLDAGMVNWTTAPATLRATAIAANLLASTPDANTTDPYVQEEAAQLNYDPSQIYNFLQTQIAYNSYTGSLRGARGTLWSDAGNSLDDASLGVALMRASGIPAQYEEGTLTTAQAQQIILSMFPASYETVGQIPAGTQTADPADDPKLQSETKDHFWFQFDAGGGMTNADPEFAGQAVGQTATASTNSFTVVPDSLRAKTEVSLTAEMYSQGAAAFGLGSGLGNTVVLDQTFNDVDLVGRPISIGNAITSNSTGSLISSTTNTYSPYFVVGDDALSPTSGTLIYGTNYQEVLTSFPFSSQILTGLFLNMTLTSPGAASTTLERTLFDRIGYAARQGDAPVSIPAGAGLTPAFQPTDVYTISVLAGLQDRSAEQKLNAEITTATNAAYADAAANPTDQGIIGDTTKAAVALTRLEAMGFQGVSDTLNDNMAETMNVVAYFDTPRVTIVSATTVTDPTTHVQSFVTSLDLRLDQIRDIPYPGQNTAAGYSFQVGYGMNEGELEQHLFGALNPTNGVQSVSTSAVFTAAAQQNIPLTVIGPDNLATLSALDISAEGKARITTAIESGLKVIVPTKNVALNGTTTIAWYEIDPTTGETTAVTEDGGHQIEYAVALSVAFVLAAVAITITAYGLPGISFDQLKIQADDCLNTNGSKNGKGLKSIIDCLDGVEKQLLAHNFGNSLVGAVSKVFGVAFINYEKAFAKSIAKTTGAAVPGDPPLADMLLNGALAPVPGVNETTQSVSAGSNAAAGVVSGAVNSASLSASGQLAASWDSTDAGGFQATSLAASNATVTNSQGIVVGSGIVAVTNSQPGNVAVSGTVHYTVNGQGDLSFYGPAESQLGVSGSWSNYSAALSGSITLGVAGGTVTLNGAALPAGSYTITTAAATIQGSGSTSSPTFLGSASVASTNGTIQLGPTTGNLTVGGAGMAAPNGATFTGYTGTAAVSAGAGGVDAVTLSGSAANVLSLSPSATTLTTDQNTPATFQVGLATSLGGVYDIKVVGPNGWALALDAAGNVTVTPAAGTQGGSYTLTLTASSETDPDLVASAQVSVKVTPTLRGMNLSVVRDTLFSVPYNGAEIPSAFRVNTDNIGPASDTYNLTFSNVPAGFDLLNSGTTVTVPAGQIGVVGLYLVPNGTSPLPAPGTNLSFTVTATSTTNSAITHTVNVPFTMPTIDVVTVASNPASVTSTPGTPTTATVTITNVGNVAANAALSATTDTGLTASGLPSTPVNVPIGKSITQTVTLTPAASAALNATLNATVSAGPAATADDVNVVSVAAALASGGASPHPGPLPEGEGAVESFAPGETVDVTADILAGVTNPRQALASFTITNSTGTTVFTSTPVTIALGALPADNTVDLGTLSTTGLAAGQYTIHVAVTETGGQAIAGATGTGTLVIDSPVTAGLSVDAEQVSPGTDTVTSTLSVANNPVQGSVETDGMASSVAVNGTLAYVAGNKDINVVDISDPSNPKIVGTFGADKITSADNTYVAVAGNDLIVGTGVQSSSNGFTVLVYTLADPKNPQFAGSVNVPYAGMSGMTIQGTTAYFTTEGFLYDSSSGSINDQFGDVAAVDFSNAAAPALLGVLFNDRAAPEGHDGAEWDLKPVAAGIAYVAGSTSTGANTQTGTGQISVVNTSNPSNLSVASQLALPNTVQALAIGVQGNTALVVGSSGGYLSPFGDPSNIQLKGNVTLTLLDISTPSSPKIIGSTIVTQNTFVTYGVSPVGKIQVVPLGNNQFAVNGTQLNGQFTVLAVDATTPASPAISTFSENAQVNNLAFAGGVLLATSATGLQVLQTNALFTTSVTAEVDVPNTGATIDLNSFSTPPTSITPGANTTALVWKLSIAPGDDQQITWQSTTSDLLPGQVEQVATGGNVQFTVNAVNETLTLPPLNVVAIEAPQTVQIPLLVRSAQTVAISQASVDAGSAGNSQLSDTLSELSDTISLLQATPTDSNVLSRTGLLLTNIGTELSADPVLAPTTTQLAPIQTDAKNGDVTNLLTAIPPFFTSVDKLLAVEAAEQFTVTVAPSEIDLPALTNQQKTLTVTVTDTGPDPETLNLSTGSLPSNVTATFVGQTQIILQPGASQNVSLNLTSNLVSTNIFTLNVRAADSTDSALATVMHNGTAIVAVRAAAADVLGVTINPIDVATSGTPLAVSASVFNTANATRSVVAQLTVLNSSNAPVGTPTDVPITLTPATTAVSFPLGDVETTGLANGVYSLQVSLLAGDGSSLPGKTSEAPFLVGIPISASVSASPGTLPPGTSTVTTTITVANTDPAGQTTGTTNALSANTQNNNQQTQTPNPQSLTTPTNSPPAQTGNSGDSPSQNTDPPAVPVVDPPTPPTPPTFSPAAGDAVKWIGAASGNWDVAANWLDATTGTNHVPDATDNVTIDASGLTITVETGDQVAQSLLVKSGTTLAVTGGNLFVTGGAEIDGAVNLGNGNHTLAMGGGATITGSMSWTDGGVLNLDGGNLFNTGTMTLSGNNYYLDSRSSTGTSNLKGNFYNEGKVVQPSGNFQLFDSVTLDNTSAGTWQFAGDNTDISDQSFSPQLVNSGLLQKSAGTATSSIDATLSNVGGTLEADSGTLRLTASDDAFTDGDFNAKTGGILDLTNGTNGTTFSGTFTGSGSGSVLLTGGTIDLSGDATFDFPAGLFNWYNNTINLEGHTLTNSGSILSGLPAQGTNDAVSSTDAGNNPLGGKFENNGTLTLQGPMALYLYGQVLLDNSASGGIQFAGTTSGEAAIAVGNDTPSFTNEGTLEKTSGSGAADVRVPFTFTTGAIKVDSGTFTLDPSSAQIAGTSFNVATGATLDLAGNSGGNVYSGTFTGTGGGTVLLENGSIVVGSAGATFNFPSGMFQWTGGGINLDGHTLTNAGSITLANNNNVSLFATDNFQGKNDNNLGGTLNNTGTIVEQGGGSLGLYDSVAFNNQSGGKYNFAGDDGIYNGNFSPSMTNSGTITKSAGTGISYIGVPLSNTGGTLEVDSGTLSLQGNGGTSTGGAFNVTGTLLLAGSGTNGNQYTGTYTGSGDGAVQIGNNGAIVIGSGGATFNFPAGLFQWTDGGINLDGNTLTNKGTITVALTAAQSLYGNGNFPGGSQKGDNQGGTLDNQGTINDQGPAAINLYDSVLLKNDTGGAFNLSGGADLTYENYSSAVANAGTFTVNDAAETSTISAPLTNSGNVTVASGELDLTGSVTNTGTLDAGANKLVFPQNSSLDNSGTVQVEGGTVAFNGSVKQDAGGTLTGGTWVAAAGGKIQFPSNANISANDANVVISGANSSITPMGALALNDGALALTSGASFQVNGDFANDGILTVGGGPSAGALKPAETSALAFDGSSDLVSVGNLGARPTQGTISFWMQPTTVGSYQNVLTTGPTSSNGAGGNQAIRFEEVGGALYADFGSDTAADNGSSGFSSFPLTTALTPGAWVNVTVTWDSSANTVTGYLNGTQVFSDTNSNFPSEFGNVTFGLGYASNPVYQRYYEGLLSDVRFYDVARSQADIQSDMTSQLTGTEAGLVGFWPLNDGSGTTAKDLTVGAHNGTLGGGTAADEPAWISTTAALDVAGNFTQAATGTLDVQLGGTPASGDFGRLAVSGSAAFAGLLHSEFVNGYSPSVGDNFTVGTYASTSGNFGAVDLAETPTVAYTANVGANTLVLTSSSATLTPTKTVVTSSAPNGANYGQLVQYTTTVTGQAGTPTGSVQFQVDGLNSGSPVALSNGQATLTLALPVGNHAIAAFYTSDNNSFANSDDSATPLVQIVNTAAVTPSTIELYYTTYGGPSSVDKVSVAIGQGTATLGTPVSIVQNIPADGLIFLPNGDLMTANGEVSEVNPNTGAVTTDNQNVSGEHLALDPSGKYVWTSPQPGPLYAVPIDPLAAGISVSVTGDDTSITHVAFDNSGQAFYVNAPPDGYGSFGLISLPSAQQLASLLPNSPPPVATTQRIYSNLPAAHGITFDPFTGDLFIVGASSVTQIDPNTLKIVSELDFPGSGFVFDQGAEDGKGHLYAADNGGHLLIVDYSATGLIGDPRNFVATPFLATDLDDVAPLSGLGGAGIPITVTHTLPATGYTVNPTSITPNPTSFSASNVTWNTTFTPGQPETDQFQLAGQATNMQPGEVRQISTGTTVTATVTAQDGTQIPVSINLPPLTVAAQHIIELAPPTDTVDQGATASYTVELTNPLPTEEVYNLTVSGLATGENATIAASTLVPAGQTLDVPLSVSVPLGAMQGTEAFLVSTTTAAGASDSVEGQLTVTGNVATNALAVNATLSPVKATAGQTNPAVYTVTVTNTGDATDTYTLSAAGLPAGFTATFSPTTITVPPGESNFRDVQLSITPPAGATAQDYPFTVTATSNTDNTVSSQTGGTVTVLAQGVQVQLTPSSAVPGSTYQLKVTNTGQAADTFNLSLASTGALVSTLGTNQVTLQPGASQTVPVTTSAANFADAGALPLTGVATSTTNSSVRGQSTADLTVPSTQSMTAAFNPSQQTLAVPGDTSFLLQVNNTGNSEDSYSATIVSTTGPITANLVGLDGQPTQSVSRFLLPGLSTGAILLQVNDTGSGQGTVTVLVQSLTNSGIQAAPTATVTVGTATPPPTASLTLTNNTGLPVAEGSSASLTKAMLETVDSDDSVSASTIVYTLTAAPKQGSLSDDGLPLAAGGTFTQQDINDGIVAFKAAEEGGDAFSFSVSAAGAASITGSFLIAVSDPAVVPTSGFTVTAVEGASSAVQTIATFTDPGGFEPQASYSANINWGDGTSSAGAVVLPTGNQTAATVTGQHSFTEQGTFTVQITLHHEGTPDTTVSGTAIVSDPAVAASGGFTYAATAGGAATSQTVAVFTDPGGAEPVGDYAATIDWGDSTSASLGSVSFDATAHIFTVSGQHTYANDGSYPIHVTLSHETAPNMTVTSTAQIGSAGVTGGITASAVPGITGYEFSMLSAVAVATFTDGAANLPASDFGAAIQWGDGTTSAGSITMSGTTYSVIGTHTYQDEGHYTASVSIEQTAGPATGGATSATVSTSVTMHEQLLAEGTVGSPNQNYIQEIYRDMFNRQAEPAGREDWIGFLTAGAPRAAVAYAMIKVATDEEFQYVTVNSLYQQYLHRAPEADGLKFWMTYLYSGGGTIEGMSEALIGSPEYLQVRGGGTVSGFLHALFQDVLDRPIDADALTYFSGRMANGATTHDIAAMIFSSSEYELLRVKQLYEQLLDRPADAAGLAHFAAELASGVTDEAVIAQILSSDEYFALAQR